MNVYWVGPETMDYKRTPDDYARSCVFRKNASQNMNRLWRYFHKHETYPEFYLGLARKVAICKCPETGKEEKFNARRCLSVENPKAGQIVNVQVKIKDTIYEKDLIFMGWAKQGLHEWITTDGSTLQLQQSFVDGLLPKDRRYLKMNA
jgi:hypothetical protein